MFYSRSRRACRFLLPLGFILLPAAAPLRSGPTLDMLAARAGEQANLFMKGDMQRWLKVARLARDFTLFQPFGGSASHGFDASAERLATLSRNFRNGSATVEILKSYATRDMAVLVMIEHQHGEVHGLPDQDWSLRVTQVYRRHGEAWQLVHRHADPLVRSQGLEATAALARGEPIRR